MTDKRDGKSLMLPLIFGLTGAGLALLFAPRSGKQTRERIRAKTSDFKDQAHESLEDMKESVGKGVNEAKDLKDRVRKAWRDKNREAMDKAREDEAEHDASQSVLSTWDERP